MEKPLVSIIVPVYNTEKYLSKCIESLCNQTYSNIEILLIDDGSSDKSLNICKSFEQIDDRIRVISKQNEGVSLTRNRGIEESNGQWITFCDSDDWLEPDTISYCSTFFTEYDSIKFSHIHHFGDRKKNVIVKETTSKEEYLNMVLSRSCSLGVCGGIYKSTIINNNLIRFDNSIILGEDWLFLVKTLWNSTNIKTLSRPLYNYNRISENSCLNTISIKKWINCMNAYCRIKETIQMGSKSYLFSLQQAKIKMYIEALKSISQSKLNTSAMLSEKKNMERACLFVTFKELLSTKCSMKNFFICLLSITPFGYVMIVNMLRSYFKLKLNNY